MDTTVPQATTRATGAAAAPLRVGLIGSGKMGLNHLKAIRAAGAAVVVGVADPAASEEDLRPLLTPDTLIVASAAEMLQRARPEVVHIVTPPGTHVELALLAIRAGCHVYVEKPFTPTAAEAATVLDEAARHGVTVCAGHQVLFERPSLYTLEHLASIGRLVHVDSYFSFKMVRRTITPAEQAKDILPHAVYPVVDQLRAGTGLPDAPIELVGVSADPSGEITALLRLGRATATVIVSLNGRPVESYQHLVGTNGSLRPDYIAGSTVSLLGESAGPGVLFTPFRRAWQAVTGALSGSYRLIFGKAGSYQGLHTLVARFYDAIRTNGPAPTSPRAILDTVTICEQIGLALDAAEAEYEAAARTRLAAAEAALAPLRADRPRVLLTGGTGLMGSKVAVELRRVGFPVRVVARRVPPYSRRIPGIEYVAADLARELAPALTEGVGAVVHCAAETAGGKQDHRRNSIDATRRLLEAAAAAGAKQVIHTSSIAVLVSSASLGRPVDESAPIDPNTAARGPYVWGKAESEIVARQRGAEIGLDVKVIRPGPLVDYADFHPPGRLGRELGPFFVGIGPKRGALSVCDVTTTAQVVRSYLEDFAAAPPTLNLVESPPPQRQELLDRYRRDRTDLSAIWLPVWFVTLLSGFAKIVQRLMGSKQPMDVAAAFASEKYDTTLAGQVIARARRAEAGPAPSIP